MRRSIPRIRPRFGKLHHFVENAGIRDDFQRRVGLGLTAGLLLKRRQIIACFVIWRSIATDSLAGVGLTPEILMTNMPRPRFSSAFTLRKEL
jgi:hypothetical protein